jgi:hypothetical protein
MSNMSYCRFENTYKDLYDCYENLGDEDLSADERVYRTKLVKLCQRIVNEMEDEVTE